MISKDLYVQGEDSADGKTPDIGGIIIMYIIYLR
jgi:hypothetical protein